MLPHIFHRYYHKNDSKIFVFLIASKMYLVKLDQLKMKIYWSNILQIFFKTIPGI